MAAPVKKEDSFIRKTLAPLLSPPAKVAHDRVLVAAADKEMAARAAKAKEGALLSDAASTVTAGSDDDPLLPQPMSDKEKMDELVRRRDASSPSGNFVLGVYKPLDASQGVSRYMVGREAAKLVTGK